MLRATVLLSEVPLFNSLLHCFDGVLEDGEHRLGSALHLCDFLFPIVNRKTDVVAVHVCRRVCSLLPELVEGIAQEISNVAFLEIAIGEIQDNLHLRSLTPLRVDLGKATREGRVGPPHQVASDHPFDQDFPIEDLDGAHLVAGGQGTAEIRAIGSVIPGQDDPDVQVTIEALEGVDQISDRGVSREDLVREILVLHHLE